MLADGTVPKLPSTRATTIVAAFPTTLTRATTCISSSSSSRSSGSNSSSGGGLPTDLRGAIRMFDRRTHVGPEGIRALAARLAMRGRALVWRWSLFHLGAANADALAAAAAAAAVAVSPARALVSAAAAAAAAYQAHRLTHTVLRTLADLGIAYCRRH